jgi:glucosylceramidase
LLILGTCINASRFGLEIKAVSPTNEPTISTFYQSCVWSGAQLRDFIKNNLGPAFAQEGITASVIMPESAD